MKQSFPSHVLLFFLFLFLLSSYSTTAARISSLKQAKEEVERNGIAHLGPFIEREEEDSLNLMGVEDCDNGDEECLKRRMISDAHLDYIYTQHHKP